MEAAQQRPGRLKIFFGYAPGIGKTYTMLRTARRARAAGADVVVGSLKADVPEDTQALLDGMERIPAPPHTAPGEFSLDAVLLRRPQLVVLDELAHTNPAGSRHIRRYQDVQELLQAGIDVYTTLSVEHLESLSDQMAEILGAPVPERIPDPVFDAAEAVVLVDLEPSELLERRGGAGDLQTLTVLRGLALRRTADRLEHNTHGDTRPKTAEHILICLSTAPSNPRVIRTAARMAEALHGGFTALFVEPPNFARCSEGDRRCLQANLRLAEELGARIATVYGDDPAIQIAEYARLSGISKIVLGRSLQRRTLLPSRPSLMDRLGTLAPDMDIYIIPDQAGQPRRRSLTLPAAGPVSAKSVVRMLGILLLCTAVGYSFVALGFTAADIIMVYILGVLCIALVTEGRGYSLLSSILSVLIFNFCFTQPYFTLISSPGDFATFGVMFLVALVGSSMTVRIKQTAIQSARKAYRTEALLETSRKLQKAEDAAAIYTAAATQLGKLLERDVLLYPVDENGGLGAPLLYPRVPGQSMTACLTPKERGTAQWVLKNNKHAGVTTGTMSGAKCLYMAVRGSTQVMAVAGIRMAGSPVPDLFEKNLMVAILDECGLALEKEAMMRAKQRVEETARQEALRANLLRAISHDLRTPLTSISGNAGILMESGAAMAEPTRQTLYGTIYDDAVWLINLVENLLSITRIENGAMKLNLRPELLDEVFHEALGHLDRKAGCHVIETRLEDDLLMATMDARLIVQVIINLVNNAVKYTPEGSHIALAARRAGEYIEVSVTDDGPGITADDRARLFEMFYTASHTAADSRRGLGLGLALCRSIAAAHGGRIEEENVQPHGACFRFTLPALEVNAYE